ncbi:hypothetical protein PNOK_0420500 [Pyrrhoderma noxium]|uniref:GmrSD restriction endonucleases C-terminal domain-containing protein n=1 Tax=Pyrrhoderma noxium TaxID=2282107 RepID=A0A286UI40_9AGAM|nr:hypothetical protein PNOK_0420500 [Pyrrhoderma noxium]
MLGFLKVFSLCALTLLTASLIEATPLESRALPNVISTATAKTYLSQLTVAAEANSGTYSRDKFNSWIIISGKCDTRETVLKRDGTNVKVDSECKPTSGSWISPYTGNTFTDASKLDIDHIVPLKEAWVSGASSWTAAKREEFANDLTRPQLLAVDASSNRSKGSKDVAKWVPPLKSYVCTYVRAFVQVKKHYGLSVDSAEKLAIQTHLNAC